MDVNHASQLVILQEFLNGSEFIPIWEKLNALKVVAQTPPTITSFTASPTSITAGQSATLTWTVANTANAVVTIEPEIGTVASSGSVQVTPAASRTYVLKVTGAQGSDSQSVTVTVTAVPVEPPATTIPATAEKFVEHLYTCTLNRASDTAGYNYWLGQFKSGRSAQELYHAFIGSAEFKNRSLSNSDFVLSMYRCTLFREPDNGGRVFWIYQMNVNHAPQDIILEEFLRSKEIEPILRQLNDLN
jgi:hypothetical protein